MAYEATARDFHTRRPAAYLATAAAAATAVAAASAAAASTLATKGLGASSAFSVAPADQPPLQTPAPRPRQATAGVQQDVEGGLQQHGVAIAGLTAPASAFAAMAVCALRTRGGSQRRGRGATAAAARGATQQALEMPVEVEVAQMEREAARLRADVAALEALRAEQQLQERRRWFSAFDEDRSGGIDAEELRRGMRELAGTELGRVAAARLLRAGGAGEDGLLRFPDFDLQRLKAAFAEMAAAEREEEQARSRAEREAAQRRRAVQELEEHLSQLPPANEDRGLATRAGCLFAYALPLVDGLRLGTTLLSQVPELQFFATVPTVPAEVLGGAAPVMHLLLFIAMQVLADDTKLPLLLRFNLRQAVLLDVALGFIGLVQGVTAVLVQGALPPLVTNAAFVFLVLCVAYAWASSAVGGLPTGIPGISEYATRTMVPTRPSFLRLPRRRTKAEQGGSVGATP